MIIHLASYSKPDSPENQLVFLKADSVRIYGQQFQRGAHSSLTATPITVADGHLLTDRIARLEAALRDARALFLEYAKLHAAKNTPESLPKALRNEAMAYRISQALHQPHDLLFDNID